MNVINYFCMELPYPNKKANSLSVVYTDGAATQLSSCASLILYLISSFDFLSRELIEAYNQICREQEFPPKNKNKTEN